MEAPLFSLNDLLRSHSGREFPISGGFGETVDAPILIHRQTPNDYVALEYEILDCLCRGRLVRWKLQQQTLLEHEGRKIDRMTIETRQSLNPDAAVQVENIYFDVTECL